MVLFTWWCWHICKGERVGVDVYQLGEARKAFRCSSEIRLALRKDGNGTSFVTIAKYPAIHTKALPKYVAPNLRGPNLVWVPSKRG